VQGCSSDAHAEVLTPWSPREVTCTYKVTSSLVEVVTVAVVVAVVVPVVLESLKCVRACVCV
jgi:hypothetical protein